MLYSSQRPIIRVLPEWMPIYNRCLSSVKMLANQQRTLGLRAYFRAGFARASPGAEWSVAPLRFPRGVFPSFATGKIMTAEPRILALGCRFVE